MVLCLVVLAAALAAPVLWDMWGSNVYASQRQAQLAEQLTAEQDPTMALGVVTGTGVSSTVPANVPPTGEALGHLVIPQAGVDAVVVVGTDHESLKSGPGWMDTTALPGQAGNAVISGHRTTYGGPFRNLDDLAPGDEIIFERPGVPTVRYLVTETLIVAPSEVWVAGPSDHAELTLTTCHPEGSDRQRLVIKASLAP